MHIKKIGYKNAELSADNDTVVIKGQIDQEKPENFLNPFFADVISQMENKVIIDISELDFLNSGGIKALISFILKRKKGSSVIIKANSASTWQHSSLKVVSALDENIAIE